MVARLSDWLAGAGLLPIETIRAAIARQAVYGGALDTALLEIDALEEGRIWYALGEATGLPLPPAALYQTPAAFTDPAEAPIRLDAAWSERCRAVPAGLEDGVLAVLCGEPVARGELDAAAAALGIPFALFVVPEVRLAAVRQSVYAHPMSPRLVRLFARVAGTQPVRRWQAAHTKPVPPPAVATGIEILAAGKVMAAAAATVSAGATPAPAPSAPTSESLPERPPLKETKRPEAREAPALATERVDKAEITALIKKLGGRGEEAEAAHAALVRLTKQDFGSKPRRWEAWWEKHQDDTRIEWLFEGLGHKQTQIRAASEEELRALTGEYFGYHFDLPRREREEARARWQSWWYESGRARHK